MKHATITDIARAAGVSKATVSRVMSRPHLVKEKTREKVLAVIDKYSYSPNILAQGLAGMPTKIIGVMIDTLANPFYIELTDGIDHVISSENYSVQLMSCHWIPERELRGIRSMVMNRVDGILMAPSSVHSQAVELLIQSGIPYILINCKAGDPAIPSICGDNYRGGQMAAEYINSLKREQTIVIDVSGHETVLARIDGFDSVINAANTRIKKSSIIRTYEDGYNYVATLLDEEKITRKKTTLFVSNDYVGMGMIARLIEMNIPIPQQVSVLGYDDIRMAALYRIPLTTVSQSIYQMGQIAAVALIERLRNPSAAVFKRIMEPRLIVRDSTAPASASALP
jgi:DNA-binding LacI/PurR family transcriptional regulator